MLLSSLHDLRADALYITLDDGLVAHSVELDNGTLVDVDETGRALGLEVIHPHREWPLEAFISRFGIGSEDARALRVLAAGFTTPTPSFGRLRKASSGSGRTALLRPIRA